MEPKKHHVLKNHPVFLPFLILAKQLLARLLDSKIYDYTIQASRGFMHKQEAKLFSWAESKPVIHEQHKANVQAV